MKIRSQFHCPYKCKLLFRQFEWASCPWVCLLLQVHSTVTAIFLFILWPTLGLLTVIFGGSFESAKSRWNSQRTYNLEKWEQAPCHEVHKQNRTNGTNKMQFKCPLFLIQNHSFDSLCHSCLVHCHHPCKSLATRMWQKVTVMQSSFAFLTEAAVRSYTTLSQSTSRQEAFPTLKFKNIPLESLK